MEGVSRCVDMAACRLWPQEEIRDGGMTGSEMIREKEMCHVYA